MSVVSHITARPNFVHTKFGCFVGSAKVEQLLQVRAPKAPASSRRHEPAVMDDEIDVDIPPRLARSIFATERPLERTKGRKCSLKRVSWKKGREDQFRPVQA